MVVHGNIQITGSITLASGSAVTGSGYATPLPSVYGIQALSLPISGTLVTLYADSAFPWTAPVTSNRYFYLSGSTTYELSLLASWNRSTSNSFRIVTGIVQSGSVTPLQNITTRFDTSLSNSDTYEQTIIHTPSQGGYYGIRVVDYTGATSNPVDTSPSFGQISIVKI